MTTIAQRSATEEKKALKYVRLHWLRSPHCIIYDRYPNGTIRIRFVYRSLIFFKKTLEVTAYHEELGKEDVAYINGACGRGSDELFDFLRKKLFLENSGNGIKNKDRIGVDWGMKIPAGRVK